MSQNLSIKEKIIYIPLGAMLWMMSKTPFAILYLAADMIAFCAYYIVGYRRKLVRRNIADSFPEMNHSDLIKTEKKFYRHLANYFVETIKLKGMSEKQLKRRMKFKNTELIDNLFKQGKSIIIYTSHYGNWEWITSVAKWCDTKDAVFAHVYRPLKNRWFDSFFLKLRSIYNVSIPMKNVFRQLVVWKKSSTLSITGFLSDQKPDFGGQTITVNFLGRPTPFIYGTEELARKLGLAVLYFDTNIERRGYYFSRICMITDDASKEPEGFITRKYVENLDATVRRNPFAYLWSHNRWRLPKNEIK